MMKYLTHEMEIDVVDNTFQWRISCPCCAGRFMLPLGSVIELGFDLTQGRVAIRHDVDFCPSCAALSEEERVAMRVARELERS